jgi:hypothetical protein
MIQLNTKESVKQKVWDIVSDNVHYIQNNIWINVNKYVWNNLHKNPMNHVYANVSINVRTNDRTNVYKHLINHIKQI